MNQKNCMVAQSGGPTVAINASLAGVIDGVSDSSMYDTVYGSLNGITGILNDDLLNLTELMDGHPEYLSRLAQTPAMYLGSCRYKLPNYLDDDSPYVFIFKQFETYHIEAFFYIGGNDSMDTVLKLSEYGKRIGSSVRIIGIPKTIDNDLCETDHTPGFGSAAKYIRDRARHLYLRGQKRDHCRDHGTRRRMADRCRSTRAQRVQHRPALNLSAGSRFRPGGFPFGCQASPF